MFSKRKIIVLFFQSNEIWFDRLKCTCSLIQSPNLQFLAHLILPGVSSAPPSTFVNSLAPVSEHPPGRWLRRRLLARLSPFLQDMRQSVSNTYFLIQTLGTLKDPPRSSKKSEALHRFPFDHVENKNNKVVKRQLLLPGTSLHSSWQLPLRRGLAYWRVTVEQITFTLLSFLLTCVNWHNGSVPARVNHLYSWKMQQHLFGCWRSLCICICLQDRFFLSLIMSSLANWYSGNPSLRLLFIAVAKLRTSANTDLAAL